MKRFIITINEREIVVDLSSSGGVLVDGTPVEASVVPLGGRRYQVRVAHATWDLVSHGTEDGVHHLSINGHRIAAMVEDERARLLRSFDRDAARQVHAAIVRAPMPGRISKVLIREGELIEAGQGICILEAMKMENEIKASATGIAKTVRMREGAAVEKNAVLVEIS